LLIGGIHQEKELELTTFVKEVSREELAQNKKRGLQAALQLLHEQVI